MLLESSLKETVILFQVSVAPLSFSVLLAMMQSYDYN